MRANQLRLYFSSFAYVLMHALRRLGTEGTQFARAQCATLRLKLLKIGARVKITARRGVVVVLPGVSIRQGLYPGAGELAKGSVVESVRIA